MLKHVSTLNLALGGFLVLPALVGAAPQDTRRGIAEQLDATVAALDYLGAVAGRIEQGDVSAVSLLVGATEPPRLTDVQRESRLVGLRGEVSRLQLALDRMLDREGGDRRLGTGVADDPASAARAHRADDHVPTTGSAWRTGATGPTTGLESSTSDALAGLLPPLQRVDPSSRMRGADTLDLEEEDFTADAVRHGKLLYRAKRYAESIQLLRSNERSHEARYWLAQSYRAVDRTAEAIEILRSLEGVEAAAPFDRYAASDLQFLEWKRQLDARTRRPQSSGAGR